MDFLTSASITHPSGETTHYYTGGSPTGLPLIFIHGWPDLAQTWHHQLRHITKSPTLSQKYRVFALDMPGYGRSSSPRKTSAYSLESLVTDLVSFAHELNLQKAIWIGHDWGAGIVSALAAHHPSLFAGLVLLSVPYRSIELGLDHLLTLVNHEIYPEDEYPFGQWEYMKAYETDPEGSIKAYEAAPLSKWTKAIYVKHDPARYGKPGPTSRVLRSGWWFATDPDAVPDIPLERTSLDEALYTALIDSHKRHGFFPPTAYYLNHAANADYAKREVNGGVLEFPVLFIDARHDTVCSTSTTPGMGIGQRECARDLSVEVVEAGHWVMLEKPGEVNGCLERWLSTKFEGREGGSSL